MKKLHISRLWGLASLFIYFASCAPEQHPSALPYSAAQTTLVGIKASETPADAYAFYSFLQQLQQERDSLQNRALNEEATRFFPDSTQHSELDLYGLEISFRDSIRLLYYEYSRAIPPESYAYLGVFSKGGHALDILPIKETAKDGYTAINLIDELTVELEYYDVYDEEGFHQDHLIFEYYKIDANGQLQSLTRPEQVSADRDYAEASLRLLSKQELEAYEPQQLELMQQELLAEYGQVFAERKWQRYFEQQDWYYSKTYEAEAQLSGLEQVNLAKIRSLLKAY